MSKFKVGDKVICLCGCEYVLTVTDVSISNLAAKDRNGDISFFNSKEISKLELLSVYESPLYKALL